MSGGAVPPHPGPARDSRARTVRLASCGLSLIVAIAAVAVATLDVATPGRRQLMLVLFCVVPGVAAWSRAALRDPVLWLVVVVATSLAVSTTLAVGLVWADWWHPRAAVVVLGACAMPLLLLALVRPPGGS